METFGTSRVTSTPVMEYDEVERLNNILEAERRLVIKTQENYRQLKEKFVKLQANYADVVEENESIRNRLANTERLQQNFHDLEEKSKEIIQQMEDDNKEREVRAELFKHDTLAELQKVFRKELADEKDKMEQFKKEKEELIEENDHLLNRITQLTNEKRAVEKESKQRERRWREEMDEQMCRLIAKIEEHGPSTSYDSSTLESYRTLITTLEEQLSTVERLRISETATYSDKIIQMEKIMEEQRAECAEKKANAEQYASRYTQMRQLLMKKEDDIEILNRRHNDSLKDRIRMESEFSQREQQLSAQIEEQNGAFEAKLSQLEAIFKEKDFIISDLRQKQALRDESISNRSRAEHQNAQSERECATMKERLEKLEKERDVEKRRYVNEMETLKNERNKLEICVCELRKKLETSPETISEIKRLKIELEQKEESLKEMKSHYRQLLKRMKNSLVNLEKRHRRVHEKLNTQIII